MRTVGTYTPEDTLIIAERMSRGAGHMIHSERRELCHGGLASLMRAQVRLTTVAARFDANQAEAWEAFWNVRTTRGNR